MGYMGYDRDTRFTFIVIFLFNVILRVIIDASSIHRGIPAGF